MKSIRLNKPKIMIHNWMDHSKILYLLQKKIAKNQPDFSGTCGFLEDFRERLNFHCKQSKVTIVELDSRQNLDKVEKWLLLHHKLFFGSLDHSKIRFWGFWMILHELATLPNVGEHLILSKFAISSRTLDHSKMQYCDFWMIQHVPYWSQIVSTIFYSEYAISSGSNRPKSKENIFCSLEHSKMLFYDFWMILHDLVVLPKVKKHLVLS